MNRTDFEKQLAQHGLNISDYKNAAYYGACEKWSLSLRPFPADIIKHAKLAIDSPNAKERAVVVNTFLSAAKVRKTPQLDQALETGKDFRGTEGSREITFTTIGTELVLNVREVGN
jgi:hypothetical protein